METEELYNTQECIYEIEEHNTFIQETVTFLLFSMCQTSILIDRRRRNNNAFSRNERLIPIERVVEFENVTISTDLNLGKFNRLRL